MFYHEVIISPKFTDSYYRMYPFLAKIAHPDNVINVSKGKMNIAVLERIAYDPSIHDEGNVADVRIYFIDWRDEIAGTVEPARYIRLVKFSMWKPSTWKSTFFPAETVKEALTKRLRDKISELRYIVISRMKDNIHSGMTVYPLPADFNLDSWITQQESEVHHKPALHT